MAGIERGKLKLYMGYAAGVGKTYHMLEAQGIDVVIGYFEPHGRKDTIAKTEGLEIIPRLKIAYRGSVFEEMNTDSILSRNPGICLVDEFAHSNVLATGGVYVASARRFMGSVENALVIRQTRSAGSPYFLVPLL